MLVIENIIEVDPKEDDKRIPIGPALRTDENGRYMAIPLSGKNGAGKMTKMDLIDVVNFDLHGKTVSLNKRGYPIIIFKGAPVLIHRQLLGLTSPEDIVDHINNDEKDNRRLNLRKATNQQNQWNSRLRKDNKTGYKGVSKRNKKFDANIRVENKTKYLGGFETPHEAAISYNFAAILLRGEYAKINDNIDMNNISRVRKVEIEIQTYERIKDYIKKLMRI